MAFYFFSDLFWDAYVLMLIQSTAIYDNKEKDANFKSSSLDWNILQDAFK